MHFCADFGARLCHCSALEPRSVQQCFLVFCRLQKWRQVHCTHCTFSWSVCNPPSPPQSVLASVLAFTPNHLLVKRLCMIRDTLCIVPNRGIGNILTEERFSELAASYCFARKTLAHCLVLHKTTLCPKYSSEFVQSCCSVWNRDINRTPVGVNCGQTAALRVSVPP